MSRKHNDNDEGYYKYIYPDLDGNGKIDAMDEAIFLYEEKKKKEKAEELRRSQEEDEEMDYYDDNYDEVDEDEDFDDDSDEEGEDADFDEDSDDFSSSSSFDSDEEEDLEESNSEYIEKLRQTFLKNLRNCTKQIPYDASKLAPFDTGEKYESETIPKRYLRKHAHGYDQVVDFKRALFERFPEAKDSFDYEDREDVGDIIVEYLNYDTKKATEMWNFLLETFPYELFDGLYDIECLLIERIINFDVDEVENVDELVKFWTNEKVYDYLFKHHIYERDDDDTMRNVIECCVNTRNFSLIVEIFEDVERRNGGFTKKTTEELLSFLIYLISYGFEVPKCLKEFITKKANTLGIRSKKILESLSEVEEKME